MKQHLKKSISLLLALLLCVGLFAFPVSAEETSGTCGDNLTWTLQNGVLTVSGKGEMADFTTNSPAPWMEHSALIQSVKVETGVTSIGKQAFYGLPSLATVTLSDTVKLLGELSFAQCAKLTQITLPMVEEIGWGCFYNCVTLTSIRLPDTLRVIRDRAFYFCDSLAGITVPASVEMFGEMVFCFCESLVYANIQAPITILPYWTFYGCTMLRELNLPSSLTTVEHNALGECPELYYVVCNGSEQAKEEIEAQLAQDTIAESNGSQIDFSQSDSATIVTVTTKNDETGAIGSSGSTSIHATVSASEGWEDVVKTVEQVVSTGKTPTVNVNVQGNIPIPDSVLPALSDRNVTVNIQTSDNADWKVILQDQTSDTLKGSQDLSVQITKFESDRFADILQGAESYLVTLGGTSLNSALLIPLGAQAARKVATLYAVSGRKLNKLSSVIVDNDGKAAFCLAGTSAGDYILALNVPDIDSQEVLIPEKLASEFDITYGATLTDAQGNQYVLTGRVNKLGFGLGTLTWIVVGVLVGSVVLVGVIMVIWNKQQKKMYRQRRKIK